MTDQNEPRRSYVGYILAGATAAIVSVLIYVGFQYLSNARSNKQPAILDNPASAESSSQPLDGGIQQLRATSENFRNIAKMVGPTVVKIASTRGVKKRPTPKILRRRRSIPEEEEDSPMFRDPFYEFFERFGQPFPFMDESPQESLGSGIIIDKRGYVVTNNHVIDEASKIVVTVYPGDKPTEVKAKVIGTDPRTDLAVLKLEEAKQLATADWADSEKVEVGDWAIAIGSPFALSQSVTVGIVSAKGRPSKALTGADYGELIQTDAAINPGNSGGPLCTLDGKVMGVNTAIYTRSGGYMGIGFAIPSNLAKDIVEKLISQGKVVRGWLGVLIQPLEEEFAKRLDKIGIREGVSVHEVVEDSPAAKAGLKAGDVIVEVEGSPVKDVTQLQRIITNFKPGQRIRIKAVSFDDKRPRNVDVKIGELPSEDKPTQRLSREDETPDEMGAIVSLAPGGKGVLVEYVDRGSAAEQGGLEPGDIIIRINGERIQSIASYKKAVGASKILGVLLKRKVGKTEGKQREKELFVTIKIP